MGIIYSSDNKHVQKRTLIPVRCTQRGRIEREKKPRGKGIEGINLPVQLLLYSRIFFFPKPRFQHKRRGSAHLIASAIAVADLQMRRKRASETRRGEGSKGLDGSAARVDPRARAQSRGCGVGRGGIGSERERRACERKRERERARGRAAAAERE